MRRLLLALLVGLVLAPAALATPRDGLRTPAAAGVDIRWADGTTEAVPLRGLDHMPTLADAAPVVAQRAAAEGKVPPRRLATDFEGGGYCVWGINFYRSGDITSSDVVACTWDVVSVTGVVTIMYGGWGYVGSDYEHADGNSLGWNANGPCWGTNWYSSTLSYNTVSYVYGGVTYAPHVAWAYFGC